MGVAGVSICVLNFARYCINSSFVGPQKRQLLMGQKLLSELRPKEFQNHLDRVFPRFKTKSRGIRTHIYLFFSYMFAAKVQVNPEQKTC